MEDFLVLALIFAFLIGGIVLGRVSARPKTQTLGTLQIDHSDPDMPYLFLLDYDLDYIATKKQAMFEIKVEDIISHN